MSFCSVQKGDQLLWVGTCTSGCSIVLASSGGRAIHFCADDDQIRPLGRAAAGIQVWGRACHSACLLGKTASAAAAAAAAAYSIISCGSGRLQAVEEGSAAAVAWQLLGQQAGPSGHMHDVMTG